MLSNLNHRYYSFMRPAYEIFTERIRRYSKEAIFRIPLDML